ncbi:hypothetical protein F4677DRAFT_407437 [Hypoxylon crocopeplum]|nr:hypothetical protein F4677DRAFT_407437 [Hypoxylon crocopeplum]
MKSIIVLATTVAISLTQIGCASASFNARQVSSTSPDMPTLTSTSTTSTVSDTATSTGSGSSASTISVPSVSSSPFATITSTGGLTETLGGVRPSVTVGGTLTESLSVSSPNAAATPVGIGAGVLAGVLGVVAAL